MRLGRAEAPDSGWLSGYVGPSGNAVAAVDANTCFVLTGRLSVDIVTASLDPETKPYVSGQVPGSMALEHQSIPFALSNHGLDQFVKVAWRSSGEKCVNLLCTLSFHTPLDSQLSAPSSSLIRFLHRQANKPRGLLGLLDKQGQALFLAFQGDRLAPFSQYTVKLEGPGEQGPSSIAFDPQSDTRTAISRHFPGDVGIFDGDRWASTT